MVVELELALIKRKQSRPFRHKSIISMQEKYETGVAYRLALCHGHAELNMFSSA